MFPFKTELIIPGNKVSLIIYLTIINCLSLSISRILHLMAEMELFLYKPEEIVIQILHLQGNIECLSSAKFAEYLLARIKRSNEYATDPKLISIEIDSYNALREVRTLRFKVKINKISLCIYLYLNSRLQSRKVSYLRSSQ